MRILTPPQVCCPTRSSLALPWILIIVAAQLALSLGGCPGAADPGGLGPAPIDSNDPPGNDPGGGGASDPGSDVAGEVTDGLRAAEVAAVTPKDTAVRVQLRAVGAAGETVEFVVVSAPAIGRLGPIRRVSKTSAEADYTPPSGFLGVAQFSYAVRVGAWESDPATARILVYPHLRFTVDPTIGEPGLTVRARVYSLGGDPLPEGTYTWSFGDQVVAGPATSHAEVQFTFNNPGAHVVRLSLTVLGFMLDIGCSPKPGLVEDRAVVTVGARIGGKVRDVSGRPVANVRIAATGTDAVFTDAQGYYQLAVPYNWSGRLSPSHQGYTFSPVQRTFRDVKLNIDNANFTAVTGQANEPPQAQKQSVETEEDTPVAIDLLASAPDSDPLTYVIATLPVHAELVDPHKARVIQHGDLPYALAPGKRQVVYRPATDWYGDDAFTFYASDGVAASEAAAVSVRVHSVNDGPRITDPCPLTSYIEMDSLESNPANQAALVAVDPDAGPGELLWSIGEAARHGTVTITGSPSSSGEAVIVAYAPQPGYAGTDELTIVVQDGLNEEYACRWHLHVGGYPVSGWVRGYDGAPRPGTPLVFTGAGIFQGNDFVATAGPNGGYSQRVPLGWSGTVTSDANHRLDPPQRVYSNVAGPVTEEDYVAFRNYYAAPGGSNQAAGTLTEPFATPQRAADAAKPGDTVVLRAGTYDSGSGSATVPVLLIAPGAGGLEGYPVTIRAADGERVVFDGRAGTTRELVQVQASYVDIEGLELTGAKRTALVVMHAGDGTHHVNVRLCHGHHNDYEASWIGGAFRTVGPVQHVMFEDCLSHNNSIGFELRENPPQTAATAQVPPAVGNTGYPQGLPESEWDAWPGWTEYGARHCAIRRCVAFDNRLLDEHSDGIGSRYAIECVIEDNIAFHNGDDNYDELGATRCTVRNNIGFAANPYATPDGDGNGMKIGVRGGLDNRVYHNVLFDNPRAGIDMADTERAEVYNNTCFNNGWFGLWIEGVRACTGGTRVLNNICNANTQGDIGALPACSIVHLDYNCVSDANNHNWARPAGPNGFVGMTAGFANPQMTIDTDFPPGLTIPQRLAYVRDQVHGKLRLKMGCACVDSGAEIPGITEGYLGHGPDRGGIESH